VMQNWRRSERRIARPFQVISRCLEGVRLRLTQEEDFEERTAFDATDLGEVSPEFLLAVDPSLLEDPSELSLVIRLADVRLHLSKIVFDTPLEQVPESWVVPTEQRQRFSWTTGVRATVAVVLRKDCRPVVGKPFMRGHWIARKDFSIRRKPTFRSFPIERWTAMDFKRAGLPPETAYWIDFVADDLNQRFEEPSSALRICLRDDVYDALASAEHTKRGRAAESLIATEVLAEALFRGLRQLDAANELEPGSLLHSAVTRVTKATGVSGRDLFEHAKEGNFSTVRAFAQATTRAREQMLNLAKRA